MSVLRRMMPCAMMVLFYATVAYANPVVGTEVRVCPTFNPAPGNHEGVEIAAGSNGYLAVWQDSRGVDADVFACRISPTGQLLDPAGISVCSSSMEQLDPVVAWNGTDYLVVWSDRRSSLQHIYCTRVRPNGEVIDPQGVCLSGTSGTQAYPRIASDGAGWEVVWQDSRGGSQDVYGCRVSGDGSLGRVMGLVTLAGNNEEAPDIAYNGTSFTLVWCDQRNSATTGSDIYGCRVSKSGLRLGSDILVTSDSTGTTGITGDQLYPRIAPCGSGNCMVAWEDYRTATNYGDIYVARISSAGSLLDKLGKPIATGTAVQEMPSIGYDGTRMLVAWRDRTYRYVRASRVSTSGSVLDGSGFNVSLSAAGSAGISVCSSSTPGFWIGWNSLSTSGTVLATWVPTTGSFAGTYGTTLSLGQDDQTSYSVADSGSEYAIVWSQRVDGKNCVMGARVSHAGVLLTPTAVNLTASIYGDQTEPSIAWNGSEYLVAWTGNETYSTSNMDIRGLRLDSTLHAKDTSAITICSVEQDQTTPCVASNGTQFMVVWEDYRNAPSTSYYYTDIYGATVDANGTPTAIASAINMSTGFQHKPRIASNGADYYVVWEDYRSGSSQIYGVKVTASRSVASSLGTAMPATYPTQYNPQIGYGGGSYFVTWSDGMRVSGCRVTAAGAITDVAGINIDNSPSSKDRPSSWWDGTQYQVVWEDYRSQFVGNSDVYYTTVGSTGVASTGPRSALVSDLIPQLKPLIFGSASSGLLFYSRYENYSDGVCFAPLTQQGQQEVASIMDAKQKPTGTLVMLRGKVVTAIFTGYFYIEEVDRSVGIKVVSSVTVHVGDMVDVSGVIGTCDAERQITTGSVTAMGAAGSPTMPFAMRGDALGGVGRGAVTGITGASGANNIGLLVKTWGKVSSTGSGYFYIDTKPGMSIKVKSGTLIPPLVGQTVAVTGVSTCEVSFGSVCRAIMPRLQSDILVLN